MVVPSFNSLLILLIKTSVYDLKCFWPVFSKKLPSVKQKLKSVIGAD